MNFQKQKNIAKFFTLASLSLGLLATSPLFSLEKSEEAKNSQPLNIGIVNFKTCVDQSKLGKEEQQSFEALRNQMESSLEAREKEITEISDKYNDADYLDSLSPEAETELKRNLRNLSQELQQIQGQYYQTLSQANMKIIQKLQEAVTAAAKAYAQEKKLDFILSEEVAFFYDSKYDISNELISFMDKNFEKEEEAKKQ